MKHTLTIESLPNGNYFVTVHQNDNIVIARPHADLRDVVSLVLLTFQPKKNLRNFQETGKDPDEKNIRG